jgi:hypothetical protein
MGDGQLEGLIMAGDAQVFASSLRLYSASFCAPRGSVVRLSAKRSQFPCRGRNGRGPAGPGRNPHWPLLCKTKPIPSGAIRRTSTWWKKSYDELDTQKAAEKQSQLPHGQQCAGVGRAAGAAGGIYRAKQSQSPALLASMGEGRQGRQAATAGPKRAKQSRFRLSGTKGKYFLEKEL